MIETVVAAQTADEVGAKLKKEAHRPELSYPQLKPSWRPTRMQALDNLSIHYPRPGFGIGLLSDAGLAAAVHGAPCRARRHRPAPSAGPAYRRRILSGTSACRARKSSACMTTRSPVAPDKILIAGGGIGGLAAALALARAGIASLVLEKSRRPGEIGAGIQLGPNAFYRIPDRLGVGEAARVWRSISTSSGCDSA